MKWQKVTYAGLISAAVLSLAACGGGGDTDKKTGGKGGNGKSEQTFTVIEQQEMPSADPSLATDVIGARALTNTYEGLYRLNLENEPEPAGAADFAEVSEDGKVYKLKLREESKWSNGDPVTAKDYVFAWQRTVDPATESEYASIFSPVKNADKITAGELDKSELGIKAVSDYELEITLEKPVPYFKYLLAFKQYFPQNQKVVEEHGKEFATTSEKAVYNGPFVLADFDGPGTDTEWAYVKNESYWDAENVKLDRIDVKVVKDASTGMNLFDDGQVHDAILTGELAQQRADDPEMVIEKLASTFYLELNQRAEDSAFRNENLRKAISYSIDRDRLAAQILGDGSVAAKGLVPADMSKNPETGKDFTEDAGSSLAYDAGQAKEYWEKAKQELGGKVPETLDILSSDTDSSKKVVEYLQGTLEENLSGIKVTVTPVPFAVRLERSNQGEFDMVLGGWSADYTDPVTFSELFTTNNAYNRGKFSDEAYDKLVESSATTNVADPAARWRDLVEAEKLLLEKMGVVPLYQKAEAHLRKSNIRDIAIHPAGAHYDYKWAYVE
ncbi:peptide ABC transporter substrate-binding protein [Vagococcus acidifermentans]|uniref:Peptide ABC transporter substrate-binding protein n=1 Tax=Vagococcus acidifermentans TaxID=564710 RepID=A0A430AWR9_9ENTE|nr:peptide ABC transporter substrate-binding protein [Vagococcus acidifermentans]RSU12500.1 peptide ABC transporter substrate-binding protein [Vagococcus acidifermentans]